MNTGNWTGQLFYHVSEFGLIANISPSYMGEFYMNNGLVGLIIGMILLGIFSRIIDRTIFKGYSQWLKVVFVTNILWLEGFIGTTILPFLKTFGVFVLLTFIISKLKSKRKTLNSTVGKLC